MNRIRSTIPGLGLCIFIGLAANLLAAVLPFGAVALAILLGMVLGNAIRLDRRFAKGITFSEKQILAVAIALMGVNLDYVILSELGIKSILLITIAITTTVGISWLFAWSMGWNRRFALLLGIGNGVCGTSAIAAAEGVIGADEEEVGLSIAIVNFLGVIGMLLLPFLGTVVWSFSDFQTGILIGNTLQAVGQVTAAGFAVSDVTGQTATIVKMGRILMLTPLLLVLLSTLPKQPSTDPAASGKPSQPSVPLFIVGFLFFSLVVTFGWLPAWTINLLETASRFALIIAMAGIGLKITFDSVLRDGRKALLVGSAIFIWQIVFSGSVIYFLY